MRHASMIDILVGLLEAPAPRIAGEVRAQFAVGERLQIDLLCDPRADQHVAAKVGLAVRGSDEAFDIDPTNAGERVADAETAKQ